MTLLFYRILSFFEQIDGKVATVRSPRSSRHARQCLGTCFTRVMGRASMESNPKFAIDLDDFESRLPKQSRTNALPHCRFPVRAPRMQRWNSGANSQTQIDDSQAFQSGSNRPFHAIGPTSIGSGPCRAIRDGHPVDGLQLGDLLALWKTIEGATNPSPWKVILLTSLLRVGLDWSFDGTNSQKFAATTMANAADFESQCWSH